ncbi:hypothetical protein PLEOSDRAFT_1090179 [Pleurotus ostreatus PC15]|uniref:Uncharacterized protein n=1 Tax=Pleurotus ostreatus (strain PC15) TaxID=1137138 RepID=A0A067NDH7_PLEO1|nr:hypothetical protein PLEOSDRAFT_1090179 [Pleurotus ostreatus PC15]
MDKTSKARDDDEANQERPGAAPPSSLLNDLVPPPGTMYFGHRSYNILNSAEIGDSDKFGTVTWNIDAYTYAAGAVAPTDPTFSAKGGSIYIVMVHSGFVKIYDTYNQDTWDRMFLEVYPSNSNLVAMTQLPTTGSGNQVGDNYNYSIDYGQSMQMLKNRGNEAFLFTAKYQQGFSRILSRQTGVTSDLVHFGIDRAGHSEEHRITEICGLSLFTHKNPSQFPVTPGWKFDINGDNHWTVSGGFTLSLGF